MRLRWWNGPTTSFAFFFYRPRPVESTDKQTSPTTGFFNLFGTADPPHQNFHSFLLNMATNKNIDIRFHLFSSCFFLRCRKNVVKKAKTFKREKSAICSTRGPLRLNLQAPRGLRTPGWETLIYELHLKPMWQCYNCQAVNCAWT
jgi:hypothetical protein